MADANVKNRPPAPVSDDQPLVGNAADAGQVRNAKRVQRLSEKQKIADMQAVLELPAGQRLVKELIASSGLFRVTDPQTPQPDQVVWFREGERNVGVKLVTRVVRARPDLISIMQAV